MKTNKIKTGCEVFWKVKSMWEEVSKAKYKNHQILYTYIDHKFLSAVLKENEDLIKIIASNYYTIHVEWSDSNMTSKFLNFDYIKVFCLGVEWYNDKKDIHHKIWRANDNELIFSPEWIK
jgi:hypothetical protein